MSKKSTVIEEGCALFGTGVGCIAMLFFGMWLSLTLLRSGCNYIGEQLTGGIESTMEAGIESTGKYLKKKRRKKRLHPSRSRRGGWKATLRRMPIRISP